MSPNDAFTLSQTYAIEQLSTLHGQTLVDILKIWKRELAKHGRSLPGMLQNPLASSRSNLPSSAHLDVGDDSSL